MAEETGKMAASPLHGVATEEDESKSSSAMFVTLQLDEQGESKDDQTEKTAAVESKDDGTEKTAAVESEDDQTEKTAAVEAQDLPAASGGASPEAAVPAPTASKAPPAMPKVEEQPGFFAGLTGQEKKDYMNERNERLKKEIRDQIQARIDKQEADRIALRNRQIELPLQLLLMSSLKSLSRAPLRSQEVVLLLSMSLVRHHLWHQLWQMSKKSKTANLRRNKCWLSMISENVPSAEAKAISGKASVWTSIVNCISWVGQMLALAFKPEDIGDGGQWSPKDWYSSGNFSKVEDELLRNEWKDQVHQLKGLPAPMEEGNVPKPVEEIFGKEPIVIEDLETGEVQAHGEVIDKSPMEAPVEKVPKVDPMSQAVKGSSYKVRNKGLKRLRSLATRIEEKKRKGEWQGPDVPVPGFARAFLEDVMAPLAEKRIWFEYVCQYCFLRLAW